MLSRTKKNISKYNDDFYLFIKNNITPEQIEQLTPEETLTILLAANDQKIKKNELKKFMFSIAIRKMIQIRNQIFSDDQIEKLEMILPEAPKGMFGSESRENKEIEGKVEEMKGFNDEDFEWFDGEDFIDLRESEEDKGLFLFDNFK